MSRVLAVSAMLAVVAGTACTRDFDGLFKETSSGNPSGLDCSCSPCTGSSCTFKCPTRCTSCKCEPLDCPVGSPCAVSCTDRAVCDVTCADKASGCEVTCEGSATCSCTGPGCAVPTCPTKPIACKSGYACNGSCP